MRERVSKRTPSPPEGRRGQGEGGERGLEGVAEIGFVRGDGGTRLAHLFQRQPLRVLFPLPAAGDPPTAVLVTTAGGLVGGDHLRIVARLGAGAQAHLTAAAAEKVYRSLGPTTEIAQNLIVGEAGRLEFLPPETILFDGARLARTTRIELQPQAGFLGGGITVFGRRARGERFTRGALRERWEVWRQGRLVWGDALLLDADITATIADPACFDGAAAFASLVLAPPMGEPRDYLAAARTIMAAAPAGLRGGVTALDGVLVARWLGEDAALLRRGYAELACHLRHAAMGLPARLPLLWHV